MEEQQILIDTAKLARKKGFDLPLRQEGNVFDISTGQIDRNIASNKISNWNDDKYVDICSAPTQELLKKWLREIHKIHVSSFPVFWNRYYCSVHIITDDGLIKKIGAPYDPEKSHNTYEEAFEEGLFKALEMIPDVK